MAPFVGTETTVKLEQSIAPGVGTPPHVVGTLSLPNTLSARELVCDWLQGAVCPSVCSHNIPLSGFATGGGAVKIFTVGGLQQPAESLIKYLNVSAPQTPALGVYLRHVLVLGHGAPGLLAG